MSDEDRELSGSPPRRGRSPSPPRRARSPDERQRSPDRRVRLPDDRRVRSPDERKARSPDGKRAMSADERRVRSPAEERRGRGSPSKSPVRDRRDRRRRSPSGSRSRSREDRRRRSLSPPRRRRSPSPRRSPARGGFNRAEGTTLFVAGFNFIVDERELEHKFSKYGRVREVRIVRNPMNGESRGFGFVVMEDPRDTRDAIRDMNGRDWNGRRILVEVSRNPR